MVVVTVMFKMDVTVVLILDIIGSLMAFVTNITVGRMFRAASLYWCGLCASIGLCGCVFVAGNACVP